MAAAAILNFTKSGILGYSNPGMANIYQDENIFIYDQGMAKNRNSRWCLPPSWILTKVGHRATVTLIWLIYQCTKFHEYIFIDDRDMTKNSNSTWRPPSSWILPKVEYWAAVTLVWSISISVPSLTKMSSFTTEIWPKNRESEWRRILTKVWFWAPLTLVWWISICEPNFGANQFKNCWDTPVYVFPRWRQSAILDLFYPNFGLSPTFPFTG